MRVFVSLLVLTFAVATIDARCPHCSKNDEDHQEIDFHKLTSTTNYEQENENTDEANDVVRKFRILQMASKKYPMYIKEAKQGLKFSDPLNLVDITETMTNGYIEYKNAIITGMGNSVLKKVNTEEIENNMFSVFAVLSRADVYGDYTAVSYTAAGSNGTALPQSGRFHIALTDCEFRAKIGFDRFPEVRPEVNAESVTCGRHEAEYTEDGGQLERLTEAHGDVPRPYAYYRDYLSGAVKSRLADEMIASFAPAIAKRLARTIAEAVLFSADVMRLPTININVASGTNVMIHDSMLTDLTNTLTVQKLENYTVDDDSGETEMLFSFGVYDVIGTANWTLELQRAGDAAYSGPVEFAANTVLTTIVARYRGSRPASVKFAVTAVDGLTLTVPAGGGGGKDDGTCESIRELVRRHVFRILRQGLESHIGRHFEFVLRNQFEMIRQLGRS